MNKKSLFTCLVSAATCLSIQAQNSDDAVHRTVTIIDGDGTVQSTVSTASTQEHVDTIYYNKNWKVINTPGFASYYRVVLYPGDPSMPKEFRTYYVTGELQGEGEFISLGKTDDSKSLFQGEVFTYFKDGKTESRSNYDNGTLEGEQTTFYDNADNTVREHWTITEGMRDGLHAEFNEEGKRCTITPYKADSREGYYVKVDIQGNYSKFSSANDKPILEKPTTDEMDTEYKNGVAWHFYNKNGLIIGVSNFTHKDFDYRELGFFIANKSMINVDLDPAHVEVFFEKKGKTKHLEIVGLEEYSKKVMTKLGKFRQKSRLELGREHGMASNLGAQDFYATNVKEFQSNILGMVSLNGTSVFHYTDEESQDLGFLRRTTIHPGEVAYGFLYTDDKKVPNLTVKLTIEGITYQFHWDKEN